MATQFRGISSYATTASKFQGPSSEAINAIISQDFFAEYHLLDYSSISGPGYLCVTSAISLLNNQDISGKAERFIRGFHPTSIYLIKGTKRSASLFEEHQSSWKNHCAASSMSTSFNKDGSVHISVKYD